MSMRKDVVELWWASVESGEPIVVQIYHFKNAPSLVFYFGNEVEDYLDGLDIKLIRRVRKPRWTS